MAIGRCMKKHHLLSGVVTICAVICLNDYSKNGSFPLLNLIMDTRHHPVVGGKCYCNCTVKDILGTSTVNSSQIGSKDYKFVIQSGPSRINELVSMDTLKQNVNFGQEQGLKHLNHPSLSRYYLCRPSKHLFLPNYTTTEKVCKERKFRINRQSPFVALVSFHGSGNTWVRHLIEQATGIFTGSIYCDPGLKLVFPGESVVSGNVVVIKTHQSDSVELPEDIQRFTGKMNFDKAILIVRNPYDALVSEANRRWNSVHSINDHIGVADQTAFISNSMWDWFVEYKGASWAFLLYTWLANKKVPALVIQYETLIKHTEKELSKILEFLNFSTTNSSVKCAVENGGGMFRRTKHLNFNPYSIENRKAMNRYISQATPILARYGIKYNHR